MQVLGEERDFVAVGQPQLTFAFIALEGGGCHKPSAPFDQQVAAELAFKSEIDYRRPDERVTTLI
jgi:hypothetical protein